MAGSTPLGQLLMAGEVDWISQLGTAGGASWGMKFYFPGFTSIAFVSIFFYGAVTRSPEFCTECNTMQDSTEEMAKLMALIRDSSLHSFKEDFSSFLNFAKK